ncbi:MAG: DJ-1/PfpI family protein [Acidobacteriaceae bacterium]|nr:DJ-1/PfpI family protein [Acidobacteriaceae bacterium]
MAKRILVVTTSNSRFEGPNPHPTGVWLSEFTEPYMEFHKAGIEMLVASPKGGVMPIDPRSRPTSAQELEWQPAMEAASNTLPLAEVNSRGFDAIFLPGGHGPMFDLPDNPHLAILLQDFFREGKIISAVCHGPVGLVGARRPNGDALVKGVTLTSYTYSEEVAANLDKEVPFILEHKLRELGANFIARESKADHVERDVQFITGQNPNSSISIARSAIAALNKRFQPVLNVVGTEVKKADTVAEFPVTTFIENIAISHAGEIYVSSLDEGKVYRIGSGMRTPIAQVERAAGLAFDPDGQLLIASSVGSKTTGVFRVEQGAAKLVVPMPDAVFLNGLTHLAGARYLAADSYRGLIWEIDVAANSYRVWIEHPALATNADPFHPVPQHFPGVNGIKLFGNHVYASSTQQQKLVRTALSDCYSAGPLEVWMTNINLDDFAFDEKGNLYGTTHIYNNLVRIDPQRRITILAGPEAGLAGSTAVAFGRTNPDATAVYVTTNGGMSLPLDGSVQPGRVVRVEVGARGYIRNEEK